MILILYIVIALVVNVALLGLGLGIGALLHWLIPAIDLGIGMLASLLTLLASFYVLIRINRLVLESEKEDVLNAVVGSARRPYLIDPLPPMPRRRSKPKTPKP